MFWQTYRAVSPEEFDRLWLILLMHFPSTQQYLQDELYPCRSQWAWAYTSFQFTCGVHTNGRIEGENWVNKLIGGPKKSATQLFNGLNERTTGQGVQDMIRVRDVFYLFCSFIVLFCYSVIGFALPACWTHRVSLSGPTLSAENVCRTVRTSEKL